MTARCTTLVLVLLAALLLAGCGGDDASSSDDTDADRTEQSDDSATDAGDDGSDDEAAADAAVLELGVQGDELKFDEEELEAAAGSVTLRLTNTSSIPHNVAVEDSEGNTIGEEGEIVGKDEVSEVTVDLEPGTYTYYCTPHKAAGMVGTLTVT